MKTFRRSDIRDEIIRAQQKQIADLLDRLQEMIGQIHYHQVEQATEATRSLSVSEEEADLQFAHGEGLLDKDSLEDALREMAFHNPNLEIDFS